MYYFTLLLNSSISTCLQFSALFLSTNWNPALENSLIEEAGKQTLNTPLIQISHQFYLHQIKNSTGKHILKIKLQAILSIFVIYHLNKWKSLAQFVVQL